MDFRDDQAAISNTTRMMGAFSGTQHTNVSAKDLARICALALQVDPDHGLAQSFAQGAAGVRGWQWLVVQAGQLREVIALAQQALEQQAPEKK
jgi:hypothetical protein